TVPDLTILAFAFLAERRSLAASLHALQLPFSKLLILWGDMGRQGRFCVKTVTESVILSRDYDAPLNEKQNSNFFGDTYHLAGRPCARLRVCVSKPAPRLLPFLLSQWGFIRPVYSGIRRL